MASSASLWRDIQTIDADITKQTNKQKEYEALLSGLDDTKSSLLEAKYYCNMSQTDLKKGYPQDGIKVDINDVADVIQEVDYARGDVASKIYDIKQEISRLKSNRSVTWDNYQNALYYENNLM